MNAVALAVGGNPTFCTHPHCACFDGLECPLEASGGLPPSLTSDLIEQIERKFFPHWFDSCHLPIIRKPDWLVKLWENSAS